MNHFGPKTHPDPLCRVVLVEPLIPENTGNISRTCVATRSELHLVEPMAFEITEARVKRAGLDYWPDLAWVRHKNYASFLESLRSAPSEGRRNRFYFVETTASKSLYDVNFQRGDYLVFGKETSGLDSTLWTGDDAPENSEAIYIPMPGTTRSLNLSNAVAVVVFELLRQTSDS